jgi:ATP-binding cassette, subfamily B, bacterial
VYLIKREFTVANEYHYNRSSPVRWILSHLLHYKHLILSFMLAAILTNVLYAVIPVLTGAAFNVVLQDPSARGPLLGVSIVLLVVVLVGGGFDLCARFFPELIGKRFARDARAELYLSLLGKSQTFHNRQRVGDIMARAANDMSQLSNMVAPGFDIIFDSFTRFLHQKWLCASLVFANTAVGHRTGRGLLTWAVPRIAQPAFCGQLDSLHGIDGDATLSCLHLQLVL